MFVAREPGACPVRVPPSGTWNVGNLKPEGSPGGGSGSGAATGHLSGRPPGG